MNKEMNQVYGQTFNILLDFQAFAIFSRKGNEKGERIN